MEDDWGTSRHQNHTDTTDQEYSDDADNQFGDEFDGGYEDFSISKAKKPQKAPTPSQPKGENKGPVTKAQTTKKKKHLQEAIARKDRKAPEPELAAKTAEQVRKEKEEEALRVRMSDFENSNDLFAGIDGVSRPAPSSQENKPSEPGGNGPSDSNRGDSGGRHNNFEDDFM